MNDTYSIDIGPDGFIDPPGKNKPKYKVKKDQKVAFNLVQGAQPVSIYFAAGTPGPFGINPLSVSSSGTGPLALQSATVGQTYSMTAEPTPPDEEPETPPEGDEPPPPEEPTVGGGKVGDIDVVP